MPVLPLVLGLVCLALFDASEQTAPPAVEQTETVRPTRLIVLMVDSLDRRDVESEGALPKLRRRLPLAGLSGPVLACVDGVTIPCVSAMITGFDRASGFSPLRNFGAARGLTERSLFGALEQRNLRVGYFGDPLLAKALDGLTVVYAPDGEGPIDDAQTLRKAIASLDRDRLSLVFVHLLALDETAHKFTATSRAYREARSLLDTQLDETMDKLRADDHVVILGDHGHAETGRHAAGLGTETYAIYFGPRFVRHVERRLAMTDHARLWAHVFGLRWGEPSAVDHYFDPATTPAFKSELPALAVRTRTAWPLALALLVALLMAELGWQNDATHGSAKNRRRCALVIGAGIMLALSLTVPLVWTWLASDAGAVTLSLVVGLAGAAVLYVGITRSSNVATGAVDSTSGRLVAGALLLALPTAEPAAGIKSPVLWLSAVLMVSCLRAWRARSSQRAAAAFISLVALLLLSMVRVRDYLPSAFVEGHAGVFVSTVLPGLLIVAAVYVAAGTRCALWAAAGSVLAQLLVDITERWLLVPCAAILLLSFVALRRASLLGLVCFLLPLACAQFFPQSAQYASVAATWLLWACVPSLQRDEPLLLRVGTCVLLMWLSFWTAMSSRVGGIDYDFYFRWLPAGAAATSDAVQQGLLTAAKCMLPTVFGVLLALRADALPLAVIKGAEHLTRGRLALTIVFVVGVSWGRGRTDVYLLYDATQEVAFWLLMFATLGLIAAAYQVGRRPDGPSTSA